MALRKYMHDHGLMSLDDSELDALDFGIIGLDGSYHGDTLAAMDVQVQRRSSACLCLFSNPFAECASFQTAASPRRAIQACLTTCSLVLSRTGTVSVHRAQADAVVQATWPLAAGSYLVPPQRSVDSRNSKFAQR